MTSAVKREDGKLVGDWQQPINRWADLPGSIHNDEVAHKVGMRGGTIPGTIHLDHFPALAHELWGERWHREGSISMYYTFATTHKEDVRAFVNFDEDKLAHDNPQLDAWVENKDGRVVCKGSLGIGSGPVPSYIRNLPLDDADPEELRILSGLKNLVNLDPVELLVEGDEEILSPSTIYHQLMIPFPQDSIAQPAVGFFGGTDIALHRGPIKGGMSYRKTGQIRSLGASPKTEFAWVDSWLHDADGNLVAEMRHMTRWMKVSSPLWQE